MLIMSYMGDHVWLMTSRHTEPELYVLACVESIRWIAYSSSMLGWNILLTKPMLGLLYGYWSGSSTWIFQSPPSNGAAMVSTASVRHQTQQVAYFLTAP